MKALLATALAAMAVLGASRDALGCGGCFAPPTETSTVTGHRMAFAVSPERTVLWDQFEYEGSPEDFSWVLPVAPGAEIQASTDAWFEALEGLTSTQVTAPIQLCASNSNGGGCVLGMSGADSASSGSWDEGGVTVLHRGTVGPYHTETLRSTSGDALTTWLTTNGYSIPTDIEPVIQAYVSEGADFIALKLSPGQGVQQMTPVRVVTPNGDALLPLRMVAAGTGAYVDIVLYIIGEGRYAMPDLSGMHIDERTITWDYTASESDYDELRAAALDQHGGRSYLTTFAEPSAFNRTYTDPNGVPVAYAIDDEFSATADDFVGLYFGRVAVQNGTEPLECSEVHTALDGTTLVTPEFSSAFVCAGATDIEAAMIGMHPADVWLTRLEMRLPHEALDADCAVELASDQEPVTNLLLAGKMENRTCPQPIFTSKIASGPSPVRLEAWMFAAVALALLGRMRAKRERLAR